MGARSPALARAAARMPEPSSFELLDFVVPVQADPSAYERLVVERVRPGGEVIRWHISGPAAEPGMLACEAVVYTPAAPDGDRAADAQPQAP
ncbi:hypothetical protein KFE25_001150 [Diacronema lutheri]|uniref:Uncharacterized protein n=1 Tax=Diacronema lutheri TaxID=2081491 RepID=A0A8J5X5K0_DIALT|nr:hypothetical protein KFE25_001150 [Diacronema lutheri]